MEETLNIDKEKLKSLFTEDALHQLFCTLQWDVILLHQPSLTVEQFDDLWKSFMGTFAEDENGNMIPAEQIDAEALKSNSDYNSRVASLTITMGNLAIAVLTKENFVEDFLGDTDRVEYGSQLVVKAQEKNTEETLLSFRKRLKEKIENLESNK